MRAVLTPAIGAGGEQSRDFAGAAGCATHPAATARMELRLTQPHRMPIQEEMKCGFQFCKLREIPRWLRHGVLCRLLPLLLMLVGAPASSGLAAETDSAAAPAPPTFGESFRARRLARTTASSSDSVLTSMMTDFYDVALVIATVFLLVMLGASVSLRRKVNEQTARIREQLKREAALEDQYRSLFENAHDVIYTHDTTGRLTTLNQAGERALGVKRAQALTANLRDFVVPEQHADFERWLTSQSLGSTAGGFELRIQSRAGRKTILEVSARRIQRADGRPEIEGIARDITERKQAEEALRQSEERFSSAFRLSPLPIAIGTLSEGRYLSVNESFLKLFGFTREEVVGRTALELGVFADPEERGRINQLIRDQRSVCGHECKFKAKNGSLRTTLLFIEVIDLGIETCTLTVAHDVTDRLHLESQLRHALKMEAVGRLAAGVAHDFNNILTVIQGNAEMALARKTIPLEFSRPLEHIADAAQRAASLTKQLLTFSRQGRMQTTPVDLNVLTNNSAKMIRHLLTDDIVLKVHYTPNLPAIHADPTMMEQVIMNLVVNARDAMPRGGQVNVNTAVLRIDEAHVKLHPEARSGEFVCWSVTDNGCGMDAATLSRIFEPFFTTKDPGKGTGLGLATVYGVAKQHQGWIEVVSEVGKGTTFHIFLPCDRAVVSPQRKPSPRSIRRGQETILVVEDEVAVGELVRGILEENGYRVLKATSGLQALQVWNEHGCDIDLVLTDMKMGKGMSGPELVANLSALRPDLKVVFTSAYAPEMQGCTLSLRDGFNFLPKPYSPPKLVQTVRARLEETDVLECSVPPPAAAPLPSPKPVAMTVAPATPATTKPPTTTRRFKDESRLVSA